MRTIRLVSVACGGALAALLTACSSTPPPAPTASMQKAPARVEYGRVTQIEPIASSGTTRSGPSVPGAIIGAVSGGTTALGAAGGATVASQVGRTTTMPQPMYRVTVQTEGGVTRYYDVPATNELRVGDSVHIEHAVIYHT
jgi:outer membrane lipoprotein SlyB